MAIKNQTRSIEESIFETKIEKCRPIDSLIFYQPSVYVILFRYAPSGRYNRHALFLAVSLAGLFSLRVFEVRYSDVDFHDAHRSMLSARLLTSCSCPTIELFDLLSLFWADQFHFVKRPAPFEAPDFSQMYWNISKKKLILENQNIKRSILKLQKLHFWLKTYFNFKKFQFFVQKFSFWEKKIQLLEEKFKIWVQKFNFLSSIIPIFWFKNSICFWSQKFNCWLQKIIFYINFF